MFQNVGHHNHQRRELPDLTRQAFERAGLVKSTREAAAELGHDLMASHPMAHRLDQYLKRVRGMIKLKPNIITDDRAPALAILTGMTARPSAARPGISQGAGQRYRLRGRKF